MGMPIGKLSTALSLAPTGCRKMGGISLQETGQQGYIGDFTSDRVTYFGYPSPVNSRDNRS